MNTTVPLYTHHHPYSSYRFESSPRFYNQPTPIDDEFDDEDQIPSVEEFNAIIDDYLNNLSPKKRDKALVDQHRYCLIQQVLRDPRNTAISTAQFRFWVKKMFQLQNGSSDVVYHDNKPVAMKEQIYDILVKAHREAHHGGRDKTSALVRKRYSWIPKELVARFVRHCPLCIARRNSLQGPISIVTKNSSGTLRYPRHACSFDSSINSIGTSSSTKEESDLSSGPPSSDGGYEATPNYLTMSSSSSPKKPYFGSIYDKDEPEFIDYQYDSSIQTSFPMNGDFRHGLKHHHVHKASEMHTLSHHSHPQPQSPLFYDQNYSGYSFYNTSYYPNTLNIPNNQETSPTSATSAAAVAVAAASSSAAAAVALMRSPVSRTSDILSPYEYNLASPTNSSANIHNSTQQNSTNNTMNSFFTPYQQLSLSEDTFNHGI